MEVTGGAEFTSSPGQFDIFHKWLRWEKVVFNGQIPANELDLVTEAGVAENSSQII